MPLPAYRFPGLLQPEIPRIYGGGVEGRALGLPPPGMPVTGGLLQPAVFDRLRAQRGLGLLSGEGTEGAPGMRGGGGGRPGGLGRNAPYEPARKFRWEQHEGYSDFQTVTPSGVR